ncbi:hypothetical protein TNCV_589811 [Trichonephila clavipes]|nr:hypothetical protein TNCV_589811 [Trichonephila clavipes]
MTSFEATKIVHNEDGRNFESTFKIQGYVYHKIGSLLTMPDADQNSYKSTLWKMRRNKLIRAAYTTILRRWRNEKLWNFCKMFCKTITNCYNCSRLFLTDFKKTTTPLSLKQSALWRAHIMFQLLMKLQLL